MTRTRSYPEDTENLEGQDIDPQSYDLNQVSFCPVLRRFPLTGCLAPPLTS